MDSKQDAIEIHKALEAKLVLKDPWDIDPQYHVAGTEYVINFDVSGPYGWYVTDSFDGWVFGGDQQAKTFKDCLQWCLIPKGSQS